MKKIKKEYNYSRDRIIWRLLPTETGKLVVEERDEETKEAYYNCVDINTGKIIFYDLQHEEKHWIGIESIYKDYIFFHKFASRDMPEHKGIIAYDIQTQKIIWQREDYIFDFISEDKIYCYKNNFEGRSYYTLDYKSGNLLEEIGGNANQVNSIREKVLEENNFGNYLFPEPLEVLNSSSHLLDQIRAELQSNHTIAEKIQCIIYNEIVLLNFHEVMNVGRLMNRFQAIDIQNKKIIFEQRLNSNTKTIVPDSFFIKDGLLFLLIEKSKIEVYSLKSF